MADRINELINNIREKVSQLRSQLSVEKSRNESLQEEVNQSNDLSAENAGIEHVTEELQGKVKLLEEENARLKGALHITLVERVVDTKIALGYEQVEDREKLIADHVARTASSLADTLRDLAKTPVKLAKRISNFIGMPQVTSEAEVTEAEENVLTVDKEDVVEQTAPVADSFEQVLVDALMGRRKL
jgi:predicted nuclease with TOPRIM domain